ncbi:MAG: NAD(P)/FAD-dependent oxidoreductase [bacterium]
MQSTFDIVIIGGGVIGSAIAYFLAAQASLDGSILVIEKDLTYAHSSTALSVGGIRQQFSTPENIEISKFGAHFFKSVQQYLAVDDLIPDLSLKESGYLFLATSKGLGILEQNYALQKKHGVEIALLSTEGLKLRFPWLNVVDLAAGTLGLQNEGWIDPYSLLMAFKKKAESLGVTFLKGEVVGIKRNEKCVTGILLADGSAIHCGLVVNAAGPAATRIAEMAGIRDLPIRSRKRFVYTFKCREAIPNCPLVIDPSGVYFRPEGDRFLCGVSPSAENDPDCTDFRMDYRLFEEVIWPALAHRVPAFNALKRGYSWAGHYAYNVLDQNAILGPHPKITNFYFANGFSGHGLQQSQAVGRALSELITFGQYRTLDLHRFGFERFAKGELVKEVSVV